jgi:hypothetical protein
MRDDSPYREPSADADRPPKRYPEEDCDACGGDDDNIVTTYFGHDAVLCRTCRNELGD